MSDSNFSSDCPAERREGRRTDELVGGGGDGEWGGGHFVE